MLVSDVDVRARFGVEAYWLMLRDPVWCDILMISSSRGVLGGKYALMCDSCILVASLVLSWGGLCCVCGETW